MRKSVTVANGAIVPAMNSGTLTLLTVTGNTLTLRDVLHVPGMFATLLSIPTIVAKAPDLTRVSLFWPEVRNFPSCQGHCHRNRLGTWPHVPA